MLCLFPKTGHILQCLAFGLWNQLPYEDGSNDADDTIETVGEPMAEVIALGEVHIEHRYKSATHDEIENPLEGYGNGNSTAADGVGEDLSNEHPGDGAP